MNNMIIFYIGCFIFGLIMNLVLTKYTNFNLIEQFGLIVLLYFVGWWIYNRFKKKPNKIHPRSMDLPMVVPLGVNKNKPNEPTKLFCDFPACRKELTEEVIGLNNLKEVYCNYQCCMAHNMNKVMTEGQPFGGSYTEIPLSEGIKLLKEKVLKQCDTSSS